jgi:uncharacterized protein YndB with AHSA1/START domain
VTKSRVTPIDWSNIITANKTVEVTKPSDTTIAVTRVFDAPAHLVWDAHTKSELVQRWLTGYEGWSMPVCKIDLRVGGAYRYEWAHPTEQGFAATGTFEEIDAPHRLVTVERMEGFAFEARNVMTFVEEDGRTTMTITMDFGTQEARDGDVATGMPDGMAYSYDLLDAVLAELQ